MVRFMQAEEEIGDSQDELGEDDEQFSPDQLKKVSRIKHHVLKKYLPPWQIILGSRHDTLNYVDCYAGPGRYVCEGETVDGSPVIAIRAADEYLQSPIAAQKRIQLFLVERNEDQMARLQKSLAATGIANERLAIQFFHQDATDYVPSLISKLSDSPSFFMIDPYAHPLTVPIINDILARERTEALINFMYYRINMDAGHPKVSYKLDELFGNKNWRSERFLNLEGAEREKALLEYFLSQLNAKYKFCFRIKMDPTDKIRGDRTKYYLVHASNHIKAVLLMKEVMWPLADTEGLFEYGGRDSQQLTFFSAEDNLKSRLVQSYLGKPIQFQKLVEETWDWPFIEKQYRSVLKSMHKEGSVDLTPVSSKTTAGLKGQDVVHIKTVQQSLFS